jgi:hypothetical protein
VAAVVCQGVKILADEKAGYTPALIYLHPDLEMPYDNAEVLYLLQIIGEKMAGFIKDHKATFRKVPMELHLELAAGGHLDTRVVSVTKTEKAQMNALTRPLGDPFTVPAGYEEKEKKRKGEEVKGEKPD